MKIKDLLCRESKGLVKKTSESNQKLLSDYVMKCIEGNSDIKDLYYEFWSTENKLMREIDRSLV